MSKFRMALWFSLLVVWTTYLVQGALEERSDWAALWDMAWVIVAAYFLIDAAKDEFS